MNAHFIQTGPGDSHDVRGDFLANRDASIQTRTEQLAADHWQDLEHLGDAFSDAAAMVGWYRHGQRNHHDSVRLLTLLRDGTDDLEAARIIRESMRNYIGETAEAEVTRELLDRDES